jgi:hypothetical protein
MHTGLISKPTGEQTTQQQQHTQMQRRVPATQFNEGCGTALLIAVRTLRLM